MSMPFFSPDIEEVRNLYPEPPKHPHITLSVYRVSSRVGNRLMSLSKAAYVIHEHKVDNIPNINWKHSIKEYNLHSGLIELFSYGF